MPGHETVVGPPPPTPDDQILRAGTLFLITTGALDRWEDPSDYRIRGLFRAVKDIDSCGVVRANKQRRLLEDEFIAELISAGYIEPVYAQEMHITETAFVSSAYVSAVGEDD